MYKRLFGPPKGVPSTFPFCCPRIDIRIIFGNLLLKYFSFLVHSSDPGVGDPSPYEPCKKHGIWENRLISSIPVEKSYYENFTYIVLGV